ncbi:hypothetical protein LG634_32680 [Streptomyces bambusae]|uniref:ATP-binding protein n=1 Tax=Streptomyces bambusae TaxID=1550616 RepID=UPI001CFFEEA1|nr:hypothetical protein [Streptomyces bambusae]MCB5169550.1 hypothetical protein [Streptomyces bambusae]
MGESPGGVRASVPAEPSSFVGREHELAATSALLAAGRLVTLTGPAGIGKTRIAVRAVRGGPSADGGFPPDPVWADLAGLPEERWAALEGELVERLADRAAVLVLDGCEQLGGTCAGLVERLLVRLPLLRVLATSQWPLGIEGEVCLPVPPLAVPPAEGDGGDDPGGYAAVRLFAERARGADPFFELTRRNAAPVARLCRALDGIPAALELAAGRLHQFAPEQALRRVEADPLRFLAGGPGGGSRRDVERTHRLCSPAERLLWERLSVFAGAFDHAAAEAVCGFGALTREEAGAALRRLAPGLLLDAGAGRYRLPLPVRAHAARLLLVRGDHAEVARRHHEWFRLTAERSAQLWRAGLQREAREVALRDLPDLRVAMNPMGGAGPAAALEIAVALWFLWAACGLLVEGRRHVERALALHPAPRPARALWLAGWLVGCLGEADGVDPLLIEGWSAAVQEGEDACVAYLAHTRGTVALWDSRCDDAAAEFREALELLPAEPEFGPGRALLVASYTMALALSDPAAVPVEDGPPVGPGDSWASAWESYAYARVLRREAQWDSARTELLRALGIQLILGDLLGQAAGAELLAALETDLGRHCEAARLLGAVDRIRAVLLRDPRSAALWSRGRAPSEAVLRARLSEEGYTRAYAEGARAGLRELLALD